MVDALNIGNWQRSGDKHARKPKPIPRPGVVDPTQHVFKARRSYTIAEMDELQKNWGR